MLLLFSSHVQVSFFCGALCTRVHVQCTLHIQVMYIHVYTCMCMHMHMHHVILLRGLPGERATVAIRTEEVIPPELSRVPGVEVATVVLVVVVQSIVELPT